MQTCLKRLPSHSSSLPCLLCLLISFETMENSSLAANSNWEDQPVGGPAGKEGVVFSAKNHAVHRPSPVRRSVGKLAVSQQDADTAAPAGPPKPKQPYLRRKTGLQKWTVLAKQRKYVPKGGFLQSFEIENAASDQDTQLQSERAQLTTRDPVQAASTLQQRRQQQQQPHRQTAPVVAKQSLPEEQPLLACSAPLGPGFAGHSPQSYSDVAQPGEYHNPQLRQQVDPWLPVPGQAFAVTTDTGDLSELAADSAMVGISTPLSTSAALQPQQWQEKQQQQQKHLAACGAHMLTNKVSCWEQCSVSHWSSVNLS